MVVKKVIQSSRFRERVRHKRPHKAPWHFKVRSKEALCKFSKNLEGSENLTGELHKCEWIAILKLTCSHVQPMKSTSRTEVT